MKQTITLDTSKAKTNWSCLFPLRRGERNNVDLTVAVRMERRPYDLTGMTAHLVWKAADGKLVGPVPMEVADPAAGTVRCTLPDACYAAVGMARAYVELRRGAELVDTTDELCVKVLDCIDADSEQAEEYKPLIGEVQDAIVAARASEVKGATAATLDPGSPATARFEDNVIELGIPRGDTGPQGPQGVKGDKGEPFTYDDFTDAQIAELKRPATEAATLAKQAISDVKATEAKLYPAAENVLVGSETGTVAHVDDAFAGATLRKITVEGACKQDGIPSPDAPKPIAVVENPVVKVVGRNVLDIAALAKESPKYYKADGDTLTILESDNRAWTATFTLPAEHPYLAKLPDGTADEIVVDAEGNVELVARVGIDKNVRDVGDFAQGQYYSLETTIQPFISPYENYGAPVMCSALPSNATNSNNEGIYRTWNGIYVKDTSGRTKEEIQAEVDKNAPLTVVAVMPETRYQLGNKIEMPKAQDSIVNAWTDAEVTPRTGIGYVRDVNIVVSNLESAIASITEG